jgi:hypothetical protein
MDVAGVGTLGVGPGSKERAKAEVGSASSNSMGAVVLGRETSSTLPISMVTCRPASTIGAVVQPLFGLQ